MDHISILLAGIVKTFCGNSHCQFCVFLCMLVLCPGFQNAVANKKQRIVLSQLKKETEFYKDNLDKSKALAAMSGRKRKRAQAEDEAVAAESSKAATSAGSEVRIQEVFLCLRRLEKAKLGNAVRLHYKITAFSLSSMVFLGKTLALDSPWIL